MNNKSTPAEITTISQLDKANQELAELTKNVTTRDRKAAEQKHGEYPGYSRFTIGSYLKGKGLDLDVAMDLIKFFRNRIALREKDLQIASGVS